MAKITINGVEQAVEDGLYLIEAARRCGVDIPHYCYHPGLPVEGNCRMCSVEVEGIPKLQTACTTIVQDGMVVITDSEKVVGERSDVMEFLLRNHPIDCPICDQAGECGLQDYYMEHGLHDSRITVSEKVKKKKRVDLGPNVVLDSERCILCTRCVRFCKDVVGTEELVIKNRSNHAEITTFPGKGLVNPYALNTVDICPVGALTSRKFRFQCRVWYMKNATSICPGCERGCNIWIDHHENKIQRLRPRLNPDVNNYWMCDEGRLDFHWINDDRVLRAEGPDGLMRPDEADRAVLALLSNPGDVLIVASPRSTNESLFALKRFVEVALPGAALTGGSFRPTGDDDGFLRLPDKNPNSRGMREIGIAGDLENRLNGSAGVVLVFENDLLGDRPDLESVLAGKKVVAFTSNRTATARGADLVVPVTTYAELNGSFTNHAGLRQEFRSAIRPPGDSRSVFDVVKSLSGLLGKELGWESETALTKEMTDVITGWGVRVEEETELHAG